MIIEEFLVLNLVTDNIHKYMININIKISNTFGFIFFGKLRQKNR
jgi:hypothetical protein